MNPAPNRFDDAAMETLLRRTLPRRPEPLAPSNLAHLAMHRARVLAATHQKGLRLVRWLNLALTTLAIAAVVWLAVHVAQAKTAAGGRWETLQTWSLATSFGASSATTAAVSGTSPTTLWLWGGSVLAAAALGAIFVMRTLELSEGQWWAGVPG